MSGDIPGGPPLPPEAVDLDLGSTGDLQLEAPEEPMIVELANDGRLRAPRQRTREMLRERLHRAELIPTGTAWALFRNLQPPAHPVEGDREVVMGGCLSPNAVALIDMIGFFASGLQTGVLTVAVDDVSRSIYLANGDVVWASSSSREDSIGEFLVRRGKITPTQLATISRVDQDRIGRACVDHGYIAAHDLWALVQAQLTEIFDKILAIESGVWTFARMPEDMLEGSRVHLSTQGLLMDSLRKLDEMRVYREVVRSSASIVTRSDASQGVADEELVSRVAEPARQDAGLVLRHLRHTATLLDLIRLSGKGEYFVTRVVYHLHKARLVEIKAHSTPSIAPLPAQQLSKSEAHGVVKIYSMAISEIFDELEAEKQSALHRAAEAFLRDPNVSFAPILALVHLSPTGALDTNAFVAALTASHGTIQNISDALSEVLFFLLFEATEMLAARRRDDLARRVRMIHAMLAPADSND